MKNDIWGNFLKLASEHEAEEKKKQKHSSAATSRKQKPRGGQIVKASGILPEAGGVLMDIGCGHANDNIKQIIEGLGAKYYGCDPFNKPMEVNVATVEACRDGKADVVTINSVLNTIAEVDVRKIVLEQAKNALNPDTGILVLTVYEGEALADEKKAAALAGVSITAGSLKPRVTKDGWQNRMPTHEYIAEVKDVFPNVMYMTIPTGGKCIVASVNVDLDLDLKAMAAKKVKDEFSNAVSAALKHDAPEAAAPPPSEKLSKPKVSSGMRM